MNLMVVVLLLVLWASILVPSAVRGRLDRSPASSISSFERSMGILASKQRAQRASAAPSGRQVMVVRQPRRVVFPPPANRRTLARRRAVLQALSATFVGSAVLALTIGGVAVALMVVTTVVLAGYVGLLVRLKERAAQTRRTVRHLPVRHASTEPVHDWADAESG